LHEIAAGWDITTGYLKIDYFAGLNAALPYRQMIIRSRWAFFVLLLTLGISYVPGYLEVPPPNHVHAEITFTTATASLSGLSLKNSHQNLAHQRLQGFFHEAARNLPGVVTSFTLSTRGIFCILPAGFSSNRLLALRTLRI
jgi:hypothetical protein